MCNITLRRVRAIVAVVEKQNYSIFRECASVAFGTLREMRMRHFVICALPSVAIFFQIIP